jgi:hypothetical protein
VWSRVHDLFLLGAGVVLRGLFYVAHVSCFAVRVRVHCNGAIALTCWPETQTEFLNVGGCLCSAFGPHRVCAWGTSGAHTIECSMCAKCAPGREHLCVVPVCVDFASRLRWAATCCLRFVAPVENYLFLRGMACSSPLCVLVWCESKKSIMLGEAGSPLR